MTTAASTTSSSSTTDTIIGFIGGGNMARSLIGGLLNNGVNANTIWVSDPLADQLTQLKTQFGVNTSSDNKAVAAQADVIVLAVKPQLMREVASGLRLPAEPSRSRPQPLFLSIAAGIREPDLRAWLAPAAPQAAIVRCMPNTPALLGAGATGLYANAAVTPAQRQLADNIMSAAGITVWVTDEAQLDAVTAVSGSGPAYYFYLMEIMEKTGIELGLGVDQARQLTLQTALGAARMALESDEPPAELRRRVTSPGGTTERAVNILQQGQLESLFNQALSGAAERCKELSAALGDSDKRAHSPRGAKS